MIKSMAKNEQKIAFSKRLDDLCKEKGLPLRGRQKILAKLCDLKQQSVSKWFNEEAIPQHEHSVILCEFFNVLYDWFLTGRGEKRLITPTKPQDATLHVAATPQPIVYEAEKNRKTNEVKMTAAERAERMEKIMERFQRMSDEDLIKMDTFSEDIDHISGQNNETSINKK
ncbi:MAG: helix-turn-helix transcriptional regulator [Proteobacteria bacterium]|nr:helix-turn-helix transcriptional regulator [Pseudomonadota bacterium]